MSLLLVQRFRAVCLRIMNNQWFNGSLGNPAYRIKLPEKSASSIFGLISQNAINLDTCQKQKEWYTGYIVFTYIEMCAKFSTDHLYTNLIHHSKVLIFIDRNKSIQMGFPAIPLKFLDTVWVFMYMYKL